MQRIIVHDYSGHPFQMQLSRELARRGYKVLHQFFGGFQTPKGALQLRDDDPESLLIQDVQIDETFEKYNLMKRFRQERRYGRRALAAARAFDPQIYIGSNIPLDPLAMLQESLQKTGCRFIVWQQDIYSMAMETMLPRRLPIAGNLVADRYRRLERRICRAADAIVCISSDFLSVLREWNVDLNKVKVIENWAPTDELKPVFGRNLWAEELGLTNNRVLLYSGSLGWKHNPRLLWEAACRIHAEPDLSDARVVVVSEGIGAEWLQDQIARTGDAPLAVLPFQPFERLSEVLASGTVLAAVLERDAGVYSVPSKVLSYLAAGRPVLLAGPDENLASRTLARIGAGVTTDPDDPTAFACAAVALLRDRAACEAMGKRARAFAELAFDIQAIGDRFEHLWTEERVGTVVDAPVALAEAHR